MTDTRRALHTIETTSGDLELVRTLLVARSAAEALYAYTALSERLPARALVMLANLREVVALLPDPPFIAGTGLDVLETAAGFEHTGHSYRRLFESEHGMFGLEFVGGGTLCEGILVHTQGSRFCLRGDEESVVDEALFNVFVSHEILLDAILEALQNLGYVLEPPIYVSITDFVEEHSAKAAVEDISSLF